MADSQPDNSAVARQYEKWVYPLPIMDLSAPEVRARRDGGDFADNFHTFWPDRPYREDLDVLIAGCGSNAAARYAFNHPHARVVGIDLSASSLAHEAYLKEKHQLGNLALHQARLEDASSIGGDFDFIDASGVLHHLPDPVSGLKALGGVLRPEGTIAIMIYGRHGRTGVYMLQEMFRLMGLGQSEEDLATVKQTLAALPKRHVVHEYMQRATDVKYDAGLVDTFLHRQDRAYSVTDCLDFTRQAGMSFMHWWDNILYCPEGQVKGRSDVVSTEVMNHPFFERIGTLPEQSTWQFMELYNGTLGQHRFAVCHPGRPESSYRIDFSRNVFMDYVPVLRCKAVAAGAGTPEGCIAVQRDQLPVYTLGRAASALFEQIDGTKSIRDCFESTTLAAENSKDPEATCRAVFRYLWRLSYVFMRIPA